MGTTGRLAGEKWPAEHTEVTFSPCAGGRPARESGAILSGWWMVVKLNRLVESSLVGRLTFLGN